MQDGKKLLIGIVFYLCGVNLALSQSVANYAFVPMASTFSGLGSANNVSLTGNTDDGYANQIPIGFDFYYNSLPYATVSVSTNGYICLGQNITSAALVANSLTAATAPSAPRPLIAPLWDNMSLATGAQISYQTSGIIPNRIFTLQWFNVKWQNTASLPGITFQVKLYENGSKIEFVYKRETGTVTAGSASIGISNAAAGASQFLSLTTAGNNAADTSTLTENYLISARPATGQSYLFVPQSLPPTAPSNLVFTSVGPTALTLNWTDNAISETYFRVDVSTDNLSFTKAGIVNSASWAGTGNNYSYAFSNLLPGTLYYFRVYACNEGGPQTNFSTAAQSTAAGLLGGIKKVGQRYCDFVTLTAALVAVKSQGINGQLILEFDSSYQAAAETYPIRFGNLMLNGLNTLRLRPAANRSVPVIIASNATAVIDFDSADYVIWEGKHQVTGVGEFVQISALSSTATAVRFRNGACNNSLYNIRITGSTAAPGTGVVAFGTTVSNTGNNSNTLSECTVKDTLGLPQYAIYALGNTGYPNLFNTLSYNNIYNYHHSTLTSYGLYLGAGNSNYYIAGNSFYQTANRNISSVAGAISINSGSDYVLYGNKAGGSDPNAGGAPTSYAGSGSVSMVTINLTASGTCFMMSNTVSNLQLNLSGLNHQVYNLLNGEITMQSNTIGGVYPNGITVSSSSTGVLFAGIQAANGSNYGNLTLQDNHIGGICLGGTGAIQFRGISVSAAIPKADINGNIIGSDAAYKPIADSTAEAVYGIYIGAGATENQVIYNSVKHVLSVKNDANTRLYGIYCNTTGTVNMYGNNIQNLIYKGSGSGSGLSTPFAGLFLYSTSQEQMCRSNTIHTLVADDPLAAVQMAGLLFYGAAAANNLVDANIIHSIYAQGAGAVVTGLYNAGSSVQVSNSMIRLGFDSAGVAITANQTLSGLIDAGNTNAYYHNTVFIGGNGVQSGFNNTYAFNNSYNGTGTRYIVNNILVNARANGAGSGTHYGIRLTTTTLAGLTCNGNIYYTPASGGVVGRFGASNAGTLQSWRTLISDDYNAGYGDPNFVNPVGSNQQVSLKVQSPTPAEAAGMAVSAVLTDAEGELRSALSATDIGADAGNYTRQDIFPPIIQYNLLTNTTQLSNRTFTAEVADSGSGVKCGSALMPRVWYRRTVPTLSPWYSTPGVLQSGDARKGTWLFVIDYSLIGTVSTGNQFQYYVAAQDSAGTPNIFYNPYNGASHSNVATQITAPTVPNSYALTASLGTQIAVGSGQAYTNLTGSSGLFAAINSGCLSGATTVTIVSDITEPGTVRLTNAGLAGYSLRIVPDTGYRVLSGSLAANGYGLITLQGAMGVTIDGGPQKKLSIRNYIGTTAAASAPAIQLLNARMDTIRNCVLESNTNAYAVVYINTSGQLETSQYLHITGNQIRPPLNVNTNAPLCGVMLYSASGNIKQVSITANRISDFTSYGVYAAGVSEQLILGNAQDTGSGNEILQSTGRGQHYYILLSGGINHQVYGNKIYNTGNAVHTGTVYGILAYNGVYASTISGNTLGGSTPGGGGQALNSTANFYGIYYSGSGNGASLIQGNRVSNIAVGNAYFMGLLVTNGKANMLSNVVGGAHITGNPADTISAGLHFYGIRYISNTDALMADNVVSNIRNTGTGVTVGYSLEAGTHTLQRNKAAFMRTENTTYTNADYALCGIRLAVNSTGNQLEDNRVFELNNSSETAATGVCGMAFTGTFSNSLIQRNRIWKLNAAGSSLGTSSPVIRGMYLSGSGSNTYANNQISLIPDNGGNQPRIMALDIANSGGNQQVYFNAVYIGGISSGNSSAVINRRIPANGPSLTLKNNIFYNDRTGSGTHVAISSNSANGFIHDYNFYVSPLIANMVEYAIGTYRTLSSWNLLSGNPQNNIENSTIQLNVALMFRDAPNGDLYSNSCRIADRGVYVSVGTDFDLKYRNFTPDLGTNEFDSASGTAAITQQPVSVTVGCGPANATFSMAVNGLGGSYQWQENQGRGWAPVNDNTVYTGTKTTTLNVTPGQSVMNGWKYRCIYNAVCAPALISDSVTLTVSTVSQWTGAVSTDWGNPGNWSCGVVPLATTDVMILPAANQPVVTDGGRTCRMLDVYAGASLTLNNSNSYLSVNGNFSLGGTLNHSAGTLSMDGAVLQNIPGATYYQLNINNAEGVYLSGNATITGTLTLTQGHVDINKRTLKMAGTTSVITGAAASRFIVTSDTGYLSFQNVGAGGRTGTVVFPVGPERGKYSPAPLQNNGTADEISCRCAAGIYNVYTAAGLPVSNPIGVQAVNRYWHLKEQVNGGSTITLFLQWNATDELPGFTRANSYISRYSGSAWIPGTTGAASGANPYVRVQNNIMSLGGFAVGSGGMLPVEWLSFMAVQQEEDVKLNWKTAHEVNTDYFAVEVSENGTDYTEAGRVKAAGNSGGPRSYEFLHRGAMVQEGTTLYYRIRQTDADGAFSYSAVETLIGGKTQPGVYFYPVPSAGEVELWGLPNTDYSIELFNDRGQLLGNYTMRHHETLNRQGLSAGCYWVRITGSNGIPQWQKLILQ